MTVVRGRPFFCSWSGGKDACLALYQAMQEGGIPRYLITMLYEDGKSSRGHRLPVDLLSRQASSIGVPLISRATSWEGYEASLLSILDELKAEGVEMGVFGDIELEEHRVWVSRVCSLVDMNACLPLWRKSRSDLLNGLIDAGFKAIIVAVREDALDRRFLGRTLDRALLQEFSDLGIDVSGEAGEYHTVVTDGPIFSSPLLLEAKDDLFSDGHWFLDLSA
jgi:diphthine-ammonia ligase